MSIFGGLVSFGNAGTGGGGGSSTTNVIITDADFSGDSYTNSLLIGKTADIDFFLYTNDGSGVLLKVDDGYTFDSGTGTITVLFGGPGNYRLSIFNV